VFSVLAIIVNSTEFFKSFNEADYLDVFTATKTWVAYTLKITLKEVKDVMK